MVTRLMQLRAELLYKGEFYICNWGRLQDVWQDIDKNSKKQQNLVEDLRKLEYRKGIPIIPVRYLTQVRIFRDSDQERETKWIYSMIWTIDTSNHFLNDQVKDGW